MKLVAPILVALAISCDLGGAQNAAKKGRVVCYYEQWAIYRGAGGQIAPKDLNPYLCTHLIYSFAAADAEGATIKSADENADFARNGFSDFIDLKTKYFEDLKLLLAVGGYNDGSKHFTPISATPASRTLFARNAMNFLRKHKFDGLNIDWQFPNDLTRNGDKMDYTNFPLLLKEVESVFEEDAAATGRPKLILSISVPGKTDIIEPGYDLPALVKYVEFINVLCYDYHYAYDPYVNHHSPIYPLPDEIASDDENVVLNADATINYILSKGVAAQKLNLGIPLYGRGFTLETEDETTLGSPATGQGTEGKATRETGYKAYFELCKDLENGYTIVRHNETAMGPYAYKGNQWIGYDDEKSVFKKGEYAKKKGLGGLSFWAIDQDDFNAVCGSKKAYPLIKAAREGYTSSQGPRLPKPPSPTQPSSTPSEGSGTQRPTPPTSRVFRPTKQVIGKMPAVEVSSFTGHQTHADFPGDYDEGIAVEAASTTAKSFSESHSTPGAPSGFVQNVYVWITNNIFNHSPPHYFDTSVQSAKPSSPVRTSPPTTTPGLESLHNK